MNAMEVSLICLLCFLVLFFFYKGVRLEDWSNRLNKENKKLTNALEEGTKFIDDIILHQGKTIDLLKAYEGSFECFETSLEIINNIKTGTNDTKEMLEAIIADISDEKGEGWEEELDNYKKKLLTEDLRIQLINSRFEELVKAKYKIDTALTRAREDK